MAYIEFSNVEKIYKMGEVDIKALDKASFEIEKGELVVILRAIWIREIYMFKHIRWNGCSNFWKCNSR